MDSDVGGYPYPPEPGGHHLALFIILILVLLAFTGGGGGLGHYVAGRRDELRRAAARKAIYKAVRHAIDKALKAREAELPMAARELMKTASFYLGPMADTGKPSFSAIDSVNKALAGRITDKPKPPELPPEAKPAGKEAGSTVVFTPSVSISLGGAHDRGHKLASEPPKPVERDMTVPEQRVELTKAIEAFDRAWQPEKVEAFLAAAQTALLDVRDDIDDQGVDEGRH